MLSFLKWLGYRQAAKNIVRGLIFLGRAFLAHPVKSFRFGCFVLFATGNSELRARRYAKKLAGHRLDPIFSAFCYNLVFVYVQHDVLVDLMRAQACFPNAHPSWRWMLVETLEYLKEWDEALAECLKLERSLAPKVRSDVLLTLGRLYDELDDHENAVRKYLEAVLAAPSKPWLRLQAAWQYHLLGRPEDFRKHARESLLECTRFSGGTPDDQYDARWHAGIAMEWLGQPHGALQSYHDAALLKPKADPCLNAARVYRKLGENQKALEMLDEAIRREPWRKDEIATDGANGAP